MKGEGMGWRKGGSVRRRSRGCWGRRQESVIG